MNDLPHIIQAVMGKTTNSTMGLVVEGDGHDSHHPLFRIERAYADDGLGPDRVIDGSCEYLHIRFTDIGTRERPAPLGQTWEVWVLTYGMEAKDWNIHIPRLVLPSLGPTRRPVRPN